MNSDDVGFDTTQAEDTGTPWWELDNNGSSDGYDIPDNMIPVTRGDGSVYYIQATESPTGEQVYSDYTDSSSPVPITYNEDGTVDAEKSISSIVGKIGETAWNALKSVFVKPDGSINWAGLATAGTGLYAAMGANKPNTSSGVYQGTIPKLTAVREAVNYDPIVDPRKAGSYGRRYFSDTTYVPEGGDLAAARAAAKTQALKMALPDNWSTYTPEQKIAYFNRNSVTPDQLLGAGEAQSDLDWMAQHGYTGAPTAPDYSGLPAGWSMYTPQQKIAYFNQNALKEADLVKYGVPASDLDWMKLHGYTGTPDYSGLPTGWAAFSPQQKIAYFNQNAIGEAELQTMGVSPSDLDWMKQNGYTGLGYTKLPLVTDDLLFGYPLDGKELDGAAGLPTLQSFAQGGAVPEFKGSLESGGFVMNGAAVRGAGGGDREQGLKALHQALGAQAIRGPGTEKSDSIPTTIDGKQPAAVANGEAYVPRQQVAQVGRGDVNQGAAKLMTMMNQLRQRGGTPKRYADGGTVTPGTTNTQGLAPWVGDYVTTALAEGQAAADLGYKEYTGKLVADESALQTQAFAGIKGLTVPTEVSGAAAKAAGAANKLAGLSYTGNTFSSGYSAPATYSAGTFSTGFTAPEAYSTGVFNAGYSAPGDYTTAAFDAGGNFTADQAAQYMNPYMQAALDPQLAEARRQAEISRMSDAARLTKAGAYGGSRQAIMESEGNRNLMTKMNELLASGYNTAYTQGREQFNTEANRSLDAQKAAELSRQYGYTQKMTAADRAAQYALDAQRAAENSRQYGYGKGLDSKEIAARLKLDEQRAAEESRQFGYTQQMTAADRAAQYGLEAAKASEQSKQFGANYGLEALNAELAGYTTAANLGIAGLNAEKGIYGAQLEAGAQERALEAEQVVADMAQFAEERDYDANAAKYKLGLLSGLPIGATSSAVNQSDFDKLRTDIAGLMSLYKTLSGGTTNSTVTAS